MSKNKSKKAVLIEAVAKEVSAEVKETFVKPQVDNKFKVADLPKKQLNKQDYDAMNLALANQMLINDNLSEQIEKTTSGYVTDVAKLQEEIQFLLIENQEKSNILNEVKEMFIKFAAEWAALKNKPFKRFMLAVNLVGQILEVLKKIVNAIDTHNETFAR